MYSRIHKSFVNLVLLEKNPYINRGGGGEGGLNPIYEAPHR